MFYRYSIFELKVLLSNRKQLFLGLLLIVLFLFHFQTYYHSEPHSLLSQKNEEKNIQSKALNSMPLDLRESEEGEKIFQNLSEQLSIVNMQIFYLFNRYGREVSEYVTDGLRLADLRIQLHELGNPYLISGLTIPIEEIEKEREILNYLYEKDMKEEINPFLTSQYLLEVTKFISGIFLFAIVVVLCSDMLVYERDHQTVMRALPVSFATKVTSKMMLYYLFILICLSIGVLLGVYRSSSMEGLGEFEYPTLIFTAEGFEAISIAKYLGYFGLAAIIAIFMIVCLTLLLNIFVKNMYGVVLAGLGLFFLPDILNVLNLKVKILYPLKYIDIAGVLSGDLALRFSDESIHYWNSIFSMIAFTVVLLIIIFVHNWYTFRQQKA